MNLLQNSFRFLNKESRLTEIIDLVNRLAWVYHWVSKHANYHDELLEDIIRVFEDLKDIPLI